MNASRKGRWDDRYFDVDSGGWIEPKQLRVVTCSAGGNITVEHLIDNPSSVESSTLEQYSDYDRFNRVDRTPLSQ
jgi:hypothetical protein